MGKWLRSQVPDPNVVTKTGESRLQFPRCTETGQEALAVFSDDKQPPDVVGAASLVSTSSDKSSWRVAGLVLAVRDGQTLNTVVWEIPASGGGENPAPVLDAYLDKLGLVRKKIAGEDALSLFG